MGETDTYKTLQHDPASAASPPALQALLRECFGEFKDRLRDAVASSVQGTNDLFDFNRHVPVRDVADFRARRNEVLAQYERTLDTLYARRQRGTKRAGRRLDARSEQTAFQLLDPADQELQVALTRTVKALQLETGIELTALSHRVARLMGENVRPAFDNPFDPEYVLDAIGWAARATYKSPLVWRALMQRIVADITPVLVKVYIAQNRFLADRNVLPQIKAELRSRSPLRPAEDRELLHAFGRLLAGARAQGSTLPPVSAPPVPFAVPHVGNERASPTPARLAPVPAPQAARRAVDPTPVRIPDAALRQALAELARVSAADSETRAEGSNEPDALPALDPLMALGTSRSVVAALARLQRMNLPQAIVRAAPAFEGRRPDAVLVPSNLIPHLRAVLGKTIVREQDGMVMDFIGLLFEYVFRDPSIPQALHGIFERLQVPIVTTAIMDAEFFTRKDHPTRRLLDGLAEASIGATAETEYFRQFMALATDVTNMVCDYPHSDTSVFVAATAIVSKFIEDDRQRTADALAPDIAEALAAEQNDLARAQVRALVRDRLAGIDVPPRIRAFIESTWVDYLARLGRQEQKKEYDAAVGTLDDVLWSLTAKERHAQRQRLAAMIPALLVALRQGCLALELPRERTADFFNELFDLHVRVLKRTDEALARADTVAAEVAKAEQPRAAAGGKDVYDFVGEMIVGSWVSFMASQRGAISRLWWVSPMRTRYLFTDRERSRGWSLTPEELAHHLETGTASMVVEPIGLFDRAVSAAFNAVGGARTAAPA